MNKTAIVVGHTKLSPGACSPHGIKCEYFFNSEIAEELKCTADIFHYDSYNWGYTSMVKRNAQKINEAKKYNLVLELHYNAASPLANGCEALYYFRNKKGKQIASEFCRMYRDAIGGKDRGAKALVSNKDRGFAAVYYPHPTTIILEPFFGTSEEDVSRILPNINKYVDVIKNTIETANNIL